MNREPIIVPRFPKCPYEESYGYIYLITNKSTGHKYIGKHVYKHPYIDSSYWASGGQHLQNALNKVNGDKSKFRYEILEWVKYMKVDEKLLSKYLAELEVYYIDLFGTFVSSEDYNETPGGDNWQSGKLNPMYNNHRFAGENHPLYGVTGKNNPNYGKKRSDESKKKMSESAKMNKDWSGENNPMYDIHLTGSSNPFYGKHHREETKRKISMANKGWSGLIGKDNPMYGKKHSESAKEKISKAQLGVKNHNYGKPMPESVKAKQRAAHLGKTTTMEHKKLLSDMWSKPVSQFLVNGSFVKSYPYGALSIGRNLKISGKAIWNACCNPEQNPVEGYIWVFTDNIERSEPHNASES